MGKADVRQVREALRQVPLFARCSPRELASIASAGKVMEHDEGDVLAREGQRGLGFFLILDGSADVSIGGRTRATLGAGDFFGEISLIDEGPRTATVTATSPVRTFALTAWTFRELIERNASIALKMLETVAARVRDASDADLTA